MRQGNNIVLCDVMNAGPALTDHIGREAATTQLDLEEALEAARYASHPYSSYPREWPPLFEVVETRELPSVLIEKYNSAGGEGTALCGIFPEIRRAWASVDNSLFLWRFDKWMVDAQCQEYTGDEQAICAVGLTKSKPGIFIEAIQHILILATPAELILVGVCCFGSGNRIDPYEEVSLQPLPEYTIPSDGVTMACVTSTDGGRIFLAGRDGHIYEMLYTSGSLWHKRCRKVCLTAGIGNIISRWVVPNVFKFGAVDAVVEMVVDNERHILYARTEEMKLLVFELGPTGDGPVKKVAEEKNLVNQRDSRSSGRKSGAPNRSVKPSIVSIAPMSTSESRCLHLAAVLSDGRRMFLSTSSPPSVNNITLENFAGFPPIRDKPTCLKLVTTRPAPPLGVNRGLAFGMAPLAGRSHGDTMSLKVETAYCSGGTVILSDSSPSSTSLLVVTRDSTTQSSSMANSGGFSRNPQALRECVVAIPIEGRMLFAANIFSFPDSEAIAHSLYFDTEFCRSQSPGSFERASLRLWGQGDLSIQHILPRRRIIIFSTMGMMEVVFNRPVDILKRLFESTLPRSALEDFFRHFGVGESAAMCLLLAAKILSSEHIISNEVSEKAAETFEDPRIVGMPKLEGSGTISNTRAAAGGFSMGQVVQEIEPLFSGAYEGICICSSHLLFPLWELPVIAANSTSEEDRVVSCRLSNEAMEVIENKIRSLETFIRTRRDQRRGLFGCVAGLGDFSGSYLHGVGTEMGGGSDKAMVRSLFGASFHSVYPGDNKISSKRQRVPYSPAELAAMEVRAIECIRQLLQRCAEALFLLQLICHHHVTRLVNDFDASLWKTLLQLTFHQLVCSEDGDRLATRLVSSLMQFYTGPDGRGTVDDISGRLRDGCPSYFKESDYKFYLAVEYLERAAVATPDTEERDTLSREAHNILSKVPESTDLRTVCKRFEDLRFYEAVVQLPLQKAHAVDPSGDAFNDQVDPAVRLHALHLREQCYDVVFGALRSLKGEEIQGQLDPPDQQHTRKPILDPNFRKKYICQIIQLGVRSPDRLFHEYLYRNMIDLGLENELLEYGGPDLVPFLQRSVREPTQEVRAVSGVTSTSGLGHSAPFVESKQLKYFDILARYYVSKRQHLLAAHVFLSLAERRHDVGDSLSIEERRQYLSKAVLQAKNAREGTNVVGGSVNGNPDNGLLELLEGKLAVLQFQIKIKEILETMALQNGCLITSDSADPSSQQETIPASDSSFTSTLYSKAKELSLGIKSISQLYNEYAQPFELWEICLEILYFANIFADHNSNIVRETWARLIEQALSRGGVSEACMVLKRVGSHIFPGDGKILPLDTLCLHLEKAALERSSTELEAVGDDEVARALLSACSGAPEPVLNVYDKLLSSGNGFYSPDLRLRLLHSVLVILHEWAMSSLAHISGKENSLNRTVGIQQGIRDHITNAENRYKTDVKRLPLPSEQIEAVYRGFCELEEWLASISFPPTPF